MELQRAGYDLSDWTTKSKGRTLETAITRDWRAEGGIDYKGETQGDFRGNGRTPSPTHIMTVVLDILFYTFAKTHRSTRDKWCIIKYIKLKLCKRYKHNIEKMLAQNTGPVFMYPLHFLKFWVYICVSRHTLKGIPFSKKSDTQISNVEYTQNW